MESSEGFLGRAGSADVNEDFDSYAVLGVADSATREEVREAYILLAARHHPTALAGKARPS